MTTELLLLNFVRTIVTISCSLSSCDQISNAQNLPYSESAHKSDVNLNSKNIHKANYTQAQLNQAKKLADLGMNKSIDGDLEAGLKFTEQALKIFPGYARGYYNRGVHRETAGDIQGAIADYTTAIELYPDGISEALILQYAYINRSSLRHDLDDNLGAIADATKAIQMTPDRPSGYTNRGLAYAALKRYDEALADQNRAIEIEPDVPGWYYNRGKTYRRVDKNLAALADFEQAISLNPNFSWAYYQRGLTHKKLGNFLAAEADFTKSLELGDEALNVYYWRGKVRMELKKYSQAVSDFDQVIGTGSSFASDYHARCLANHYAGNFTAARADALKAAELYRAEGSQEDYQGMMAYVEQSSHSY
jgi:tetratricopeptide (TPR) repeat protein